MEDTYIRFEPNPLKMQAWKERLRLGLDRPSRRNGGRTTDPLASLSPGELYARAIPIFVEWKERLIESRVWREAETSAELPPGMLFVLETTNNSSLSPVTRSKKEVSADSASSYLTASDGQSYRGGAGGEGAVLALPAELSAFIEYRTQLEEILQDPLLFYPYLDRKQELVLEAFDEETPSSDAGPDFSNPCASTLTDIFYLLQLLIPGILLIVHDSLTFGSAREPFHLGRPPLIRANAHHARGITTGGVALGMMENGDSPMPSPADYTAPIAAASARDRTGANAPEAILSRTRRGVPPAKWIRQHMTLLEGIFGVETTRAFRQAAEDQKRSLWTTVYAADGRRLDVGYVGIVTIVANLPADQYCSPEMELETHPSNPKPTKPTPPGVTPGREVHSLYTDFARRSRTL